MLSANIVTFILFQDSNPASWRLKRKEETKRENERTTASEPPQCLTTQPSLHCTHYLRSWNPRLASMRTVSIRLRHLLGRFCENCGYNWIALHLRKPRMRNMNTNFSQPVSDGLRPSIHLPLRPQMVHRFSASGGRLFSLHTLNHADRATVVLKVMWHLHRDLMVRRQAHTQVVSKFASGSYVGKTSLNFKRLKSPWAKFGLSHTKLNSGNNS